MNKEQYIKMNQKELNSELLDACGWGNIDIVQFLLSSPYLKEHADINHKNNDGVNALLIACSNGHLDIVQYLLTSLELTEYADIYHKDNCGWNSLMYASYNGYLDIVQYLVIDMNINIDKETMNWLQGKNDKKEVYENNLKVIEIRNLNQKLDGSIQSNKQKITGIKI